jgi:hypothetical protein
MDEARHRRGNLIREKRPDNKRNPNAGRIDTETSGTIVDPSSRPITSQKWFWPGLVSAILVVLAGRILIKRRK